MDVVDYLGKTVPCTCGRAHSVEIRTIEIDAGVLAMIPALLEQDGHTKPFIVFDSNTYEVAGKKVLDLLDRSEMTYITHFLQDPEPVPDEAVLGRILMDFEPSCDVIIGIGSGTINDLSRLLSYQLGREYYIVATAPSMDGYASTGAALIRDNLKVTFPCHEPSAIIADLDVIATAPTKMIAAGFGDVIGKYTCLIDWKLCKRQSEHTFHLLCVDEKMNSSSTWRSWFLWPEKQSKSYGRTVSERSNLAV